MDLMPAMCNPDYENMPEFGIHLIRPKTVGMLSLFSVGNTQMSFVTKRSIKNQFYSDLVAPLENGISAPGTTVHIFYAVKMGPQYLERYERHFKAPISAAMRCSMRNC